MANVTRFSVWEKGQLETTEEQVQEIDLPPVTVGTAVTVKGKRELGLAYVRHVGPVKFSEKEDYVGIEFKAPSTSSAPIAPFLVHTHSCCGFLKKIQH